MSNLLSITERQRLRRSQSIRGVAFVAAACGGIAAVAALALAPAYISLTAQRAVLERQLAAYEASAEANAQQADRESLARTRQQLHALANMAAHAHAPTEALMTAFNAQLNGVRIYRVTYQAGDTTGTLTINGAASVRTTLSAYVTALKQQTVFEEATVPVGALAETDEGLFTITTRGDF